LKRLFLIALSIGALAATAASPVAARSPNAEKPNKGDNRTIPLARKEAALKLKAQEMVLRGKATPKGDDKVVKVAKGQYVQLAFQGEDQILTLLGDFGNEISATYGGTTGPVHNQIPEPDRTVDNVTLWAPNYDRSHYENLLFNKGQVPSMANWYLKQSSGRYSVDGYVSDWVSVPHNEAYYGSDYCGDIICEQTWQFLRDQANAWWGELVAEKGEQGAKDFLATFDVWDRYDYDGDGNFNEPDGYIDHFQSVHAGEGEETDGGAQGSDAIWSHRWSAFYQLIGSVGPSFNKFGGFQIGDSGKWVFDYTIEPENGGVGVFAHEFGHDLGLPDEYDRSGNTGGAENGTGWWTNWSQGSYGTIDQNGLGNYPVSMDAWEKFELGWLNYGVTSAGQKGTYKLGPVEANTKKLQGLFVLLPDSSRVDDLGAPAEGDHFYYTGSANDLDTSMTRSVTLPSGTVTLAAKARYNIEQDWDYAYLTVNGTPVHTSLSTNTSPNGQNFGEGITGVHTSWVNLTADLSAFAGQTVMLGLRYWTDTFTQGSPGVVYPAGFQIDAIQITSLPTDGAESDAGWTMTTNSADAGFHVTDGQETLSGFFNAYLAEYRQYRDYDVALKLGPYQYPDPDGKFVEHLPYQDGMVVWYWNTAYADNNVGTHPGGGQILPVDAHPAIEHWSDGTTARPRLQSYDAAFSLDRTNPITVHSIVNGTLAIPSHAGVSTFDDSKSYWVNGDPGDTGHWQSEWNSVKVPHTGTKIRVVGVSAQGSFMEINLN